ncbi:MAG: formylglycine-generating enzyme family protein [Thermoguttaceae bacterium]|nr:formylglycine-generating enzyme family protein [Thermoguttaceae bacterium]
MMGSLECEPGRFLDARYGSDAGNVEKRHGKRAERFSRVRLPVEQVGWVDCVEFCRKLSEKLGVPVALPTEAQWEYACRAGSAGPFAGNLEEMAWFGTNSENRTHSVGMKKPNAWGLYDMHGNVWEWCLNWYAEDAYADGPSIDPHGPKRGVNRVYRGGGWYGGERFCRSAYRNYYAPNFRSYGLGFRIILK